MYIYTLHMHTYMPVLESPLEARDAITSMCKAHSAARDVGATEDPQCIPLTSGPYRCSGNKHRLPTFWTSCVLCRANLYHQSTSRLLCIPHEPYISPISTRRKHCANQTSSPCRSIIMLFWEAMPGLGVHARLSFNGLGRPTGTASIPPKPA